MNFSPTWCLLLVCARASLAREWAWPDGQESVSIDTKVRFLDDATSDKSKRGNSDVQSDEAPFRQPTTTDGFYNRPPGAGRFPVRVVDDQRDAYRVNSEAVYRVQSNNDGTVDSVQFCKCVSTPECNPRRDSAEVCGAGKYLCCYKRPNRAQPVNSEFFNEIEDERPMMFPGKERLGGPFPPPPNQAQGGFIPNHNSEYFDFGAVDTRQHNKPVLVGPGGPTGNIGPPQTQVLVGPGGPTGNIGPTQNQVLTGPRGPTGNLGPSQQQVLIGPGGPTGVIGPAPTHNSGNRGVLVGPTGPTGVIGPAKTNQNLVASAAAQRGVLVGPGGPTGIIGPYGNRAVLTGPRGPMGVVGPNRNRGVLVGPGGPTGIIGPGYGGFGRQSGPGLLVGPGGPTGTIGPGRQLLVGPGGPTGRIGPQRYFVYETKPLKRSTRQKNIVKVENKTETEFSRSAAASPALAVHPRTFPERPGGSDSGHHQSPPAAHTAHTTHAAPGQLLKRLRRSCTRGCSNSSEPGLRTQNQKGYRIRAPVKPTRRPRPTHKKIKKAKRACPKPGGGCGSAPRAPLSAAAPSPARRMGIEEYPRKRNKPKPTPNPALIKKIIRNKLGQRKDEGEDDEGGDDFLSQLFSYVISSYMEDMKTDPKEVEKDEEWDRDKYGEIIYTTQPPTTKKPSIFRKIPIYLAFLKIIKAMIVFGIM